MNKITHEKIVAWLPKRDKTTYKNKLGHCLLIGGNENKGGAIMMSALAAINSGAGLTTVATVRINQAPLHGHAPEVMFVDLDNWQEIEELLDKVNVIVIGPGMGLDSRAERSIYKILTQANAHQAIILDADALTLYGDNVEAWRGISKAKIIMTPHAGEWERITHYKYQEVINNEVLLMEQARKHHAIIVAKGAPTHVITANAIYENTAGNPSQATGGMGDTLTGIIASFVGQFGQADPLQAVLAAVYLHSYTADILAEEYYVTLPTLLSQHFPIVMKQIVNEKQDRH